jgi:kynurenine formamidase
MRGGVLIAEQLQRLDQLVGIDDFIVRALPIALSGSDGAPARIVAETADR